MKFHRSSLGLMLLIISLSMAKTIPTSEPVSSTTEKKAPSLREKEEVEKATKPEEGPLVPEVPAAIDVEGAQEPKQADRAKKSATTTFCVEIRPGQNDGPVKVCDNPPPPQPPPPPPPQSEPQVPPQDLHQETYHEEHEQLPFFVIPPNPLAVFIPNEGINCPQPNIFHNHNNQVQVEAPGIAQHIIIPSSGSVPCPPAVAPPSQHIIIPSSGSVPCQSVPSSPSQHIIIPSSTSGSSQHIVFPSTGGAGALCPCQSSASINYPQTLISLFRSAMARNDDGMSPLPMEMRSASGNPVDWMNSGSAMLTEGGAEGAPDQMSWDVETPFARTHNKKIYSLPIGSYYGSGVANGYQPKAPYVVQCNPQVLALGGGASGPSSLFFKSGKFRDAQGNSDITNMENVPANMQQPMNEARMNLAGPQQAGRHVIYPMVQPIIHHSSPGASLIHGSPSVFQHSSTHQTYQSRPIYPSHDSGYMLHPGSHFYRREGTPEELKMWNNAPSSARNNDGNPSSDMEMTQRENQQGQGKSWNPQMGNMERTSSDGNGNGQQERETLSPSQMINQMRGLGSSSFGRKSPVMQSFPREHDDSTPCKEGVHVNMHLPSGGQPYIINTPRNRDDKPTSHGIVMHDEMGKREAEKSPHSEIDG